METLLEDKMKIHNKIYYGIIVTINDEPLFIRYYKQNKNSNI